MCVGTALRLRDRLAPRRPSSVTAGETRAGVEAPCTIGEIMGEYGRGVDDEKDETWRRMTNSWVAFVSFTMFARNEDGRATPCVFKALDN